LQSEYEAVQGKLQASEDDLGRASKLCDELQARLQEVSQDRDACHHELERGREQLEGKEAELLSELEGLSEQVKNLQIQEEAFHETQAEERKARADLDSLQSEYEAVQGKLQASEDDLGRASKLCDELQARLQEVSQDRDACHHELERGREQLEGKEAELLQEIAGLSEQVKSLQTQEEVFRNGQLMDMTGNLTSLTVEKERLSSELEEARVTLNETKLQLQAALENAKRQSTELESAQHEVARLSKLRAELEHQLNDAGRERDSYRQQLQRHDDIRREVAGVVEMEALPVQLDKALRRQAELEGQLAESVSTSQHMREECTSQIDSLMFERNSLLSELEGARLEMERVQQQLEECEKERDDTVSQLRASLSTLRDQSRESRWADDSLKDEVTLNDKLQMQLEELRLQLECVECELAEVGDQRDSLAVELQEKNHALSDEASLVKLLSSARGGEEVDSSTHDVQGLRQQLSEAEERVAALQLELDESNLQGEQLAEALQDALSSSRLATSQLV